jgi:hypothetical protein
VVRGCPIASPFSQETVMVKKVYGVFVWTNKGIYQEKDAIKVFKSIVAANNYIAREDTDYSKGYVVRTIYHDQKESSENP